MYQNQIGFLTVAIKRPHLSWPINAKF